MRRYAGGFVLSNGDIVVSMPLRTEPAGAGLSKLNSMHGPR